MRQIYYCHVCALIGETVVEIWFLNDTLFTGVQFGRPDLVPRTPPLGENPADYEVNLSTSSLGSTGLASTSPPLR